ncbi:MAG: hypothetical protein ABIE84_04170 [bacterium]
MPRVKTIDESLFGSGRATVYSRAEVAEAKRIARSGATLSAEQIVYVNTRLAQEEFNRGKTDKTIELLKDSQAACERIRSLDHKERMKVRTHNLLGVFYWKRGQNELALAELSEAVLLSTVGTREQNPALGWIYLYRACVYWELGKGEESSLDIALAAQMPPTEGRDKFNLLSQFLKLEIISCQLADETLDQEALGISDRLMRESLIVASGRVIIGLLRVRLLEKLGRPEESNAELQRIRGQAGSLPDRYFILWAVQLSQVMQLAATEGLAGLKDYIPDLNLLLSKAAIVPTSLIEAGYMLRGLFHFQTNNLPAATRDLLMVTAELDILPTPLQYEVLAALVDSLGALGRWAEGLAQNEKILGLADLSLQSEATARYKQGQFFLRLNRDQEALAEFQTVIDQPEYPRETKLIARADKVAALVRLGRPEEALTEADTVLAESVCPPRVAAQVRHNRGAILLASGQLSLAREDLTYALEASDEVFKPQEKSICHALLSLIEHLNNRPAESNDYWRRSQELSPNRQTPADLLLIYLRNFPNLENEVELLIAKHEPKQKPSPQPKPEDPALPPTKKEPVDRELLEVQMLELDDSARDLRNFLLTTKKTPEAIAAFLRRLEGVTPRLSPDRELEEEALTELSRLESLAAVLTAKFLKKT